MKRLLPLVALFSLFLLTGCSSAAWQQLAQGSAEVYTQAENRNAYRQNLNYQAEQHRLSGQNSNNSCNLACRQQKHNMNTQLLNMQMQQYSAPARQPASSYPAYHPANYGGW